jgi:hypothetical protein
MNEYLISDFEGLGKARVVIKDINERKEIFMTPEEWHKFKTQSIVKSLNKLFKKK